MRCKLCGAICRNVLHTSDGREIYLCSTNYTHLTKDLKSLQGFIPCIGVYDQTGKQLDLTEYLAFNSEGNAKPIRVYDLVGR